MSLAAFLLALVYLFDLARLDLGDDGAGAALLLLAAYPFAVFFSAVYTESLFLLGVAATFLAARHRRWAVVGAWGLLVGLRRSNGCLLSIPVAMVACGQIWPRLGWMGLPGTAPKLPATGRERPAPHPPPPGEVPRAARASGRGSLRRLLPLVAAGMSGVGMLLYSGYMYQLTGNPLEWAAAQWAWGRGQQDIPALLLQHLSLIDGYGLLGYLARWPAQASNAMATIFALATAWPVARRFGYPYAAFVLLGVLPPLLSGGLESMGRYTSVLFPVFFVLALTIPARHRVAWASGFGVIQGLFAAVFFTGRTIY